MARKWDFIRLNESIPGLDILLSTFYYYLKKDLLKSYWSTDSVLITRFPRTVMPRVDFYNILSFLHCCNNSKYISKDQPGYNPKKNLMKFYRH